MVIGNSTKGPDVKKKKKKRNIGQEIVQGLKEFTRVLESGEPLEYHFRVTTIEKVNAFENIATVKGPKTDLEQKKLF